MKAQSKDENTDDVRAVRAAGNMRRGCCATQVPGCSAGPYRKNLEARPWSKVNCPKLSGTVTEPLGEENMGSEQGLRDRMRTSATTKTTRIIWD
jgi:hypothetical protein